MHTPRSLASVALAVVLGLAPLAVTAAPPAEAEEAPKLLLMLDASGSMRGKDPSGLSKIDAAKAALNATIDALPEGSRVGLRVYGATQPGGKPTPAACADTQLIHPIQPLDRAGLKSAVAGFTARGETPIAYSLRQSMKELGSSGPRRIILVSDGEESCVPDPCPEVKKLTGAGVDLRIDTVGFGASAKTRQQLQCIADATGGEYYEAGDQRMLQETLKKTATRALRPFGLAGSPVRFTTDLAQAQTVTPGRYSHQLTGNVRSQYLKIKRHPGSTVRVSLASQLRSVEGYSFFLYTPDLKTTCSAYAHVQGSFEFDGRVTATARVPGAPAGGACVDADTLVLVLDRAAPQQLPLQILYTEEAPVTNKDALAPALSSRGRPDAAVPAHGSAQPVVGGGGIFEAPLIGAGTHADTILPGERLFYRVHLEEGQRLRVVGSLEPDAEIKDTGFFAIKLWDPALADLRSDDLDPMPGVQGTVVLNRVGTRVGAATREVRYNNRDGWGHSSSLAGDYLVSFGLSPLTGVEVPIPLKLTVAVDGSPASVRPSYEPLDAYAARRQASPPPGSSVATTPGRTPLAPPATPTAQGSDPSAGNEGNASTPTQPQAPGTPGSGPTATGAGKRESGSPSAAQLAGLGLIGGGIVAGVAYLVTRRRPVA